MRVTHIALVALLLGTGLSLGACDSLDNLTNMLDTKKRLPGDRRPVFPDGVPGVEMGVPPEMMKGYQEKQQAEQAQTPPGAPAAAPGAAGQAQQAAQEPPEKPKPKKVVTRPKPKPAPSDTSQQASQPAAQTQHRGLADAIRPACAGHRTVAWPAAATATTGAGGLANAALRHATKPGLFPGRGRRFNQGSDWSPFTCCPSVCRWHPVVSSRRTISRRCTRG